VVAAVAAKAVGDVAAISGNVALKQECTLVAAAAAAITTTVAAIVIVIVIVIVAAAAAVAVAIAGIAGRLGL